MSAFKIGQHVVAKLRDNSMTNGDVLVGVVVPGTLTGYTYIRSLTHNKIHEKVDRVAKSRCAPVSYTQAMLVTEAFKASGARAAREVAVGIVRSMRPVRMVQVGLFDDVKGGGK